MGEALAGHFDMWTLPFLERDRLLRDLLRTLPPESPTMDVFCRLYGRVLQAGHHRIAERLDVIAWTHRPDAMLNHPSDVARHFTSPSPFETPIAE